MTNFHVVSRGNGFVSRSAMFSAVGIYWNVTSLALVRSFIKWCRISICFVRRWFLSFVLIEIDPILSAHIITGFAMGNPISKYLDNHSAWVVALENAMNSASTVDNATVSCLFVSHDIGPPAARKILSSVDRLVFLHPAKSESTKPTGSMLLLARYVIP